MKHTLVRPNGSTGKSFDFTGAPPALSANKGRWLPDVEPAYNNRTHKAIVDEPVPANATEIPYTILPLPPARAARFAKEDAYIADMADMKADAFTKQFAAMTPADVNNYVNSEVTDPGTRQVLRRFGRILLALTKREFVGD